MWGCMAPPRCIVLLSRRRRAADIVGYDASHAVTYCLAVQQDFLGANLVEPSGSSRLLNYTYPSYTIARDNHWADRATLHFLRHAKQINL